MLEQYRVVVRVIASIESDIKDDSQLSKPWDQYDSCVKDGTHTLRADTSVDVHASSKEHAVEEALDNAPPTGLDDNIYNLHFWVDTEQCEDVEKIAQ
ncbi:hypothetical protein [Vibrio alginolyticus]|uniref:hypothetical protein n=1 Tax=Vibrio TaxID=662 RepID=UPI0006CAA45E|nr:hypothetical protein [Vibrio alginolyticus]KPM97605.1 hypothetical protein AOG25_14145 [Vibrio alginolyticus]CAH7203078.1 conserved hypothetical protein [Vibrio chagasii]CAH7370245.1 conserved hypothetical protein [Vibrio chagasii]